MQYSNFKYVILKKKNFTDKIIRKQYFAIYNQTEKKVLYFYYKKGRKKIHVNEYTYMYRFIVYI